MFKNPKQLFLFIFIIVVFSMVFIILALSMLKFMELEKSRKKILIGKTPLYVEVFDSPSLRERGLMFRKNLEENHGALFVFDEEAIYPFWMKNTFLALSIAFISKEGIITEIQDMFPLDTINKHFSSQPIKYAIETNLGWFERNNINIGDTVFFIE